MVTVLADNIRKMALSDSKPSLLTLLTSESISSALLSLPIIRQEDLATLSLASKSYRLAATPFLYSRVVLNSPVAIRQFLGTILSNSTTYAAFVHTMYLCSHRGQARLHHTVLREMTNALASVLPHLRNLEIIYLSEIWSFSAAIFASHANIVSPLRDCRLNGIGFSNQNRIDDFIAFLATQQKLQILRLGVTAVPDDYYERQTLPWEDEIIPEDPPVLANCLPALTQFDGPVFVAAKVLKSMAPLEFFRTHTALEYDAGFLRDGHILPVLFSSFIDVKNLCADMNKSKLTKALKSVVVVGFPGDDEMHELHFSKKDPFREAANLFGDVVGEFMHILALRCSTLIHVGVLPLSSRNRSEVHAALMEMPYLRSIEFSVNHWVGPGIMGIPDLGLAQASFPNPGVLKAISIELKMYCPTLRYFIYNLRHTNSQRNNRFQERVIWIYHVRPPVNHEKGVKSKTNEEGEWVHGDPRSSWEELWTMVD
ncbi:hypothetical protein F5880DRAFT_1700603 [Lentinula raphanica]|nr:hypothetical protein F5880DRAFT_1700603 [Lentinula raphanica]